MADSWLACIMLTRTPLSSYNENRLRVQKTVNGVVTKYTLHGKNIVHMTQGSNELHFFYDAQNKPVVVIYNGTLYSYVKNLQGDIVAILNSAGTAVVNYVYDAWGRPVSKTGSMASTLGTVQPFRYRGYVYDEETGLYYLRSRYYLSQCSRFINGDSIISLKTLLSMSAYTYCHNAPPNRTDLSGMEDAPATMGHKTSCSTSGCDGCYSGPPPAATINPYQFNSILPATPIFDADYQLVDWHYSVIPISDAEAREYVKSCINLKKTHDFPGRVVNIVVMAYIPFDKFFAPLKYGKELAFLGKSSGVLKEVYDASPIAKIDMTFDIQTADYSSMVAHAGYIHANIRHPMTDSPLIAELIGNLSKIDSLRSGIRSGESFSAPRELLERNLEIRRIINEDVSRNDSCPCQSGLKYKKCCGRFQQGS